MRFDTHLHVWWPDDGAGIRIRARLPELDRDFSLETVLPALAAAGVEKAILVSAAQEEADTERLLDVAAAHPQLVRGVIGWLDLEAGAVADRIAHYRADPNWLGARLPLTIIEDRRFIARPAVIAALRRLAETGGIAEILAAPDQLDSVAETLGGVAGLRVVVDHAGNPDFAVPPTPEWRAGVARLATLPGAVCKVSSFWAPGDPPLDAARALPFFAHIVDCFGPARMIAAANWPVSTLLGPYDESWRLLDRLAPLCGLSAADAARILFGTAHAFFSPRLPRTTEV